MEQRDTSWASWNCGGEDKDRYELDAETATTSSPGGVERPAASGGAGGDGGGRDGDARADLEPGRWAQPDDCPVARTAAWRFLD